ncbi:MAG: OmpP1/FadL family transporter [Legionellales bacterium]
MKSMHTPLRTVISSAVLSILATGAAHSAAFALYGEGNAAATGNYGAGLAAEAADASIGWYNPAGLVLIRDQQLVFGGVGVFPRSTVSGSSNFITQNPISPSLPPLVYGQTFDNLATEKDALVPSLHYALPLGENTTFGLSLTSPFGLATNWAPDSPVRYEATYTEVITTTISPEIGARIMDNFSVGAGLDLQYARVKFNRMLGAPTLTGILYNDPMLLDSLSYNKGSSYGIGFHAGVLGMFNENHTRIGLNYQSEVRHQFYGFSRLTGNLATPSNIFDPLSFATGTFLSDSLFSNSIDLPQVVTLSGYQDVNDKLALLGSVIFTGWNVFQNIQLNNVAAAVVDGSGTIIPALVNSSSPQNYTNAWRVALGANYHVSNQLMVRVGGGYDQTPTNDLNRDVRLPDLDRWALAIGARYQVRPNLSVDAGYTHLFGIEGQGLNRTDITGATSTYTVNASTTTSADLVGLQLNWTIDKVPEAPMK